MNGQPSRTVILTQSAQTCQKFFLINSRRTRRDCIGDGYEERRLRPDLHSLPGRKFSKTLSAYPEQNRSPSILLGDGLKQNYLKPNRDNLIKRTPVLVG